MNIICSVIYMFLSNNPSSGDINSSNLSCLNMCLGAQKNHLIETVHLSTHTICFG